MRNILFSLLLLASDTSHAEVQNLSSSLVHEDAEEGLRLAFESSVQLVSISEKGAAFGSGNLFIYNGEQYIITANHVVAGSLFLDILEKDGNVASGIVFLTNPELDLAIIKPVTRLTGTTAVDFEFANDNKLGKEVYHCGHPIGVSFNLSKGMITTYEPTGYIINSLSLPGTSGSVVFDKYGKVVGVIVSVAGFGEPPNTQLIEGIVKVIPIDLKYVIDSM